MNVPNFIKELPGQIMNQQINGLLCKCILSPNTAKVIFREGGRDVLPVVPVPVAVCVSEVHRTFGTGIEVHTISAAVDEVQFAKN